MGRCPAVATLSAQCRARAARPATPGRRPSPARAGSSGSRRDHLRSSQLVVPVQRLHDVAGVPLVAAGRTADGAVRRRPWGSVPRTGSNSSGSSTSPSRPSASQATTRPRSCERPSLQARPGRGSARAGRSAGRRGAARRRRRSSSGAPPGGRPAPRRRRPAGPARSDGVDGPAGAPRRRGRPPIAPRTAGSRRRPPRRRAAARAGRPRRSRSAARPAARRRRARPRRGRAASSRAACPPSRSAAPTGSVSGSRRSSGGHASSSQRWTASVLRRVGPPDQRHRAGSAGPGLDVGQLARRSPG